PKYKQRKEHERLEYIEKLKEIANKFDVQILYLPPYSPDLNPIEKV
ncbi:transposase, partial [Francisella tularensis]